MATMTKRTKQVKTDYITPGCAAAQLGMSVRTLARLADNGTLSFIRIGAGHRRFDRHEIQRLSAGNAS